MKLLSWLLFSLLNCALPHLNAQSIEIEVGVILTSNEQSRFKESTDGTSCLNVKKYVYKGSSRGYAEALLICQALTLGGIEPIFKFHQFPNYGRALKELKKGSTHLMLSTNWLSQKSTEFYVSQALMEAGEFEKGIYTLEGNEALLNISDLEHLENFTALANKAFTNDWQILSQLGVDIYSNSSWQLLFKMVKAKRGDFILAEFSSKPDMSIMTAGIKLIPVPRIKIIFNDSRHVFVNKNRDDSALIFAALQSGLKVLHQRGTIKKAYRSLGFYNENTKRWRSLCCQGKNNLPANISKNTRE